MDARDDVLRLLNPFSCDQLVMKDGRTGIVEDTTVVVAQVVECAESLAAFVGCLGRTSMLILLLALV